MNKIIENNNMLLQLKGDLVASRVKELVEKAKHFIETDETFNEVVLDIKNVKIIDSIGISFIVGLYKSIASNGRKFKVTGTSEEINQLFTLMKLDEVFEIGQ